MEQLETSGKSVEEAIRHALEELGATREQVEVTVLSEGRSGILGIGAEEARVRVIMRQPGLDEEPADVVNRAKTLLEELLERMDLDASVEISHSPFPVEDEESQIFLEIKGEDLGILIGRRGQTLASLQYILRVIMAHREDTWIPIIIDVEGYKRRRFESLQVLAERTAEEVASRHIPIALRPMPPYERRVVHLALANHPSVLTESSGEGDFRKVVIQPKSR